MPEKHRRRRVSREACLLQAVTAAVRQNPARFYSKACNQSTVSAAPTCEYCIRTVVRSGSLRRRCGTMHTSEAFDPYRFFRYEETDSRRASTDVRSQAPLSLPRRRARCRTSRRPGASAACLPVSTVRTLAPGFHLTGSRRSRSKNVVAADLSAIGSRLARAKRRRIAKAEEARQSRPVLRSIRLLTRRRRYPLASFRGVPS